MRKFRAEETVILKRIHSLAIEIESCAEDGKFPEVTLNKLIFLLSNLAHSESLELRKIAEIQDHLHPQMTVRHFLNFMVPVERCLGNVLSDDEFLVTSVDRPQKTISRVPLVFILENLRSAFNVGSIFRLADCVGASEIHLCGYTPFPDEKTSLGTTQVIEFKKWDRLEDCLQELQGRGISICALETAENAVSLFQTEFTGPTALYVGNERFGIAVEELRKADKVIEIPMSGMKNSLNVACALSVAAFEWKRQWMKSSTHQ